jgi:putative sigma-54 modulation protein
MNVNVTFRNLETTQAIKEYSNVKLDKVRKVLVKPINADVVLSTERFNSVAEVTITAKDVTFKGSEKAEDMYAAIDLVMDKVERQARRYKERTKQKKGRSSHKDQPMADDIDTL